MHRLILAAADSAPAPIWGTEFLSTVGEFALLALLIGAALVLLAREQRRLVLLPIVFLFLSASLYVLSMLFSGIGMMSVFGFLAELLLFAAVGRICFVLAVTILQRVLRWSPQKIYLDVCMAVIYVMVLVPVLSKAGLKTSELVTGTTLITAILALAMQSTLGNIFAGIALHLQHPFELGDWIQFDDKREHIGKVKEISWRATTVVTLDSVEVVIPNSKLAEMPLTNFMRPERHSRRSIYFVCPYSVPPARVHEVVLNAIVGARGVVETPAPTIVTNAFTDRGIEYWLRFFTELLDIRDGIDGGVRDRVWYSLNREGITMPPAVHQVELTETSPELNEATARHRLERHEKILQEISLCQGLPETAFQILARESQMRRYLPSEVIIRQDDPGMELFVVSTGTVSVSVMKAGNASVEVTRLGPGDYFGEMSLLLGDPRTTSVTAISECELLVIGKQAFADAFAESPQITATISKTIAARRVELDSRLAQGTARTTQDDEVESLMMKIQKYFGIV